MLDQVLDVTAVLCSILVKIMIGPHSALGHLTPKEFVTKRQEPDCRRALFIEPEDWPAQPAVGSKNRRLQEPQSAEWI